MCASIMLPFWEKGSTLHNDGDGYGHRASTTAIFIFNTEENFIRVCWCTTVVITLLTSLDAMTVYPTITQLRSTNTMVRCHASIHNYHTAKVYKHHG